MTFIVQFPWFILGSVTRQRLNPLAPAKENRMVRVGSPVLARVRTTGPAFSVRYERCTVPWMFAAARPRSLAGLTGQSVREGSQGLFNHLTEALIATQVTGPAPRDTAAHRTTSKSVAAAA